MKFTKYIAAIIALFSLDLCQDSFGQVGQTVFASGGTVYSAKTNYAIIPSGSLNGGAPVVTYLNATGDSNAVSVVRFYTSTNKTYATAANGTTTNYVANTNGFSPGKVVILRHLGNPEVNERLVVSSTQLTNQLVFQIAPVTAAVIGDIYYQLDAGGIIPVGTNTVSLSGSEIYAGQAGVPLLLEVNFSTTTTGGAINAVGARYSP